MQLAREKPPAAAGVIDEYFKDIRHTFLLVVGR